MRLSQGRVRWRPVRSPRFRFSPHFFLTPTTSTRPPAHDRGDYTRLRARHFLLVGFIDFISLDCSHFSLPFIINLSDSTIYSSYTCISYRRPAPPPARLGIPQPCGFYINPASPFPPSSLSHSESALLSLPDLSSPIPFIVAVGISPPSISTGPLSWPTYLHTPPASSHICIFLTKPT